MPESDIAIYDSVSKGVSFELLSEKDKNIFLTGTLMKVSVVTGCNLPEDKTYRTVLFKEINSFLLENARFKDMTSEEIVTAFRFNAAGNLPEKVEHYNRIFNLDYLGKVLEQWLPAKRRTLAKAHQEIMRVNILEPVEIIGDIKNEQAVSYSKDAWSRFQNYLYILSSSYNYLKDTGKLIINDERKEEIKTEAQRNFYNIASRGDYRFLSELYWRTSKENEIIIERFAKKMAVEDYFKKGSDPILSQNES